MNADPIAHANHLLASHLKAPHRRLLAAIAGIPGSGKSTFAARIAAEINASANDDLAIVVSMDGWHLAKAELDTLLDPAEAHRRRGAPFTFDPPSLLAFVRSLRLDPQKAFRAPSFDHAKGDPEPDAIAVLPSHRIVIFEGLYLHLEDDVWRDIHGAMDETWFLACPEEVALARLAKRHVETGLGNTE
ncbi:P-loop containing nucleoside triphosphate hydrolase protein [Blyttiomyces helicus]|uniref:P-loop containing nucleoside triphosphate hydrolase protein n=1 Tax=Blyttiomyces helicus TaxID=388810 RepID=A0A4V1IQ73_9FUNG|nr:P-loop containing nucleoside triphosphate hydrolase protein [Blyttiomyces helicus]|eukprot:RKO85557.1 P-loop containing nucleoside triphosphate hydrolase protein [Blyttiomyces helicus]